MSQSEVKEWKDCFALFDSAGKNKISNKELGTVVRSLGMNPTDADVERLEKGVIGGKDFSFDDLCKVMNKLKSEPRFSQDDIKDAFKVFDRDGHGMVNAAELRHIMTNLGEKLTDEEVDEMIRAVDVNSDGLVAYETWVKLMAYKA